MADKSVERESINGYILDDYFSNLSGYARWTFAEKDRKQWFIKEFFAPVWPMNPELIDPDEAARAKKYCQAYYKQKRALYDVVNSCDTGNIVTIHDFFRWDAHYYVVTEKIPSAGIKLEEASKLDDEKKLLLLKILANNLQKLHEHGVVYADLCPDNIILKKTDTGNITAKLIDFDGCFFEKSPPKSGGLPIREKYISPEVADIFFDINKIDRTLTTKLDVFSLGLLFHLCWVGKLPGFNSEEYPYACAAVLEGETLEVSEAIPPNVRALITRMLSREPADRPDMTEVVDVLMGRESMKSRTDDPVPNFWNVPVDL